MSHKKSFFRASFAYSLVQVLTIAASLISFPVLTRLLSVAEYGLLSLCNALLLFGAALAKLGMQHSIVRFFAYYRRKSQLVPFVTTMWYGGTAAAVVMSLLLLPVAIVMAPVGKGGPFVAVVLVVFGTAVFAIANNLLRGEERNQANGVAMVLVRYLGTFGGIALLYWGGCGLSGIFYAQVAVLISMSIWYFREYKKRFGLRLTNFSWGIFREALSFGSPLIVYEVSSILLGFSDRFLVGKFCGPEQLGIYTAGYTVSFCLADLVRQPLQLAVTPIFLRIHEEKGPLESADFLQEVIGYVSLVILPLFAGCTALRHELLVLLASSKYAGACDVVPWVLGSTLLIGCQSLLASSFLVYKETNVVAVLSLVAAVINISLNFALLPSHGFMAAAWTTAAAYLLLTAVMAAISYRKIRMSYPVKKIALYSACSTLMYCVISALANSPLLLKIATGCTIYTVSVLVLDRKLFAELRSFDFGRRLFHGAT